MIGCGLVGQGFEVWFEVLGGCTRCLIGCGLVGQGFEVWCEVCVARLSVVCEACRRSGCVAVLAFVVCGRENEVGI